MAAPTIIAELVERFARNRPSYQAAVYNETQISAASFSTRFSRPSAGTSTTSRASSKP